MRSFRWSESASSGTQAGIGERSIPAYFCAPALLYRNSAFVEALGICHKAV